jgi:cytoskeletal protein CcmA (bactofilin family)
MGMAFGGGRREGDNTTVAKPAAPASAPGDLSAFIDQGSEFEGKLSFKDTVRIDGHFRGEITSENTLIVGETGTVEATIHSKNVVISGSVAGDVFAPGSVVLHKSARLDGNIETPHLSIEDGATFNGSVSMKAANKSGNVASLETVANQGVSKQKG